MVQLTHYIMTKVSQISRKRFRGTFLDKVHVNIQAGNGGMGNQKYGGVGGKGGDVYMKASAKIKDLLLMSKAFPERQIKAGHGSASIAKQLMGQRGKDVTVSVPCGVKAITDDKLIIGEVNKEDETVLLARGGMGGSPATSFSGMRGQKLNVTFELSLIADVGLLGFPNAGKSTLLKACSNANPKIAAYPFTTIKPNIGVLGYDDYRQITMADLPGVIEGAHANHGMGHKFLRHIERTKLVLMVVDVQGFQLGASSPRRSAIETILLLSKELELYNPVYLEKPMALIINKMDLPGSDKVFSDIKDTILHCEEYPNELPEGTTYKRIHFDKILPISAHNRDGVQAVKDYVRESLKKIAEEERSGSIEKNVEDDFEQLKSQSMEKGPGLL